MSTICDECGAEIVHGDVHRMLSAVNGVTRIVTQCLMCADYYAWACWNDEEWGPYPSRLTHNGAGKA
jgi:hypothetical protein